MLQISEADASVLLEALEAAAFEGALDGESIDRASDIVDRIGALFPLIVEQLMSTRQALAGARRID